MEDLDRLEKIISENIKKYKEMRNLTTSEVAKRTQTSFSAIYELINNKRRNYTIGTLLRVANAIGVPIEILFSEKNSSFNKKINKEILYEESLIFYKKFKKLNDRDQKTIEKIIKMWSKDCK